MNQNKQKKKKSKTDTSKDKSEEKNTQEIDQLKEKNKILKGTIKTQENQIENLYHEINNLQEKNEEHNKPIKALNKLDRDVKRMNNKNRKIKNFW